MGVPLYQFNKIKGLEGSQLFRWGSFFDQRSHAGDDDTAIPKKGTHSAGVAAQYASA
jgi:hypothetical protein